MSSNLYAANRQWASRPADERYWNISELYNALEADKNSSQQKTISLREIACTNAEDDLALMGRAGSPARLTNWSFQQLCQRTGTPTGLTEFPAGMVAPLINYKLNDMENQDIQLFLHRNGRTHIKAITTEKYSRIYDLDILDKLTPAIELGWMTPPARPVGIAGERTKIATQADILPNQGDFGLAVKEGDEIAPAGVYRGDRNMFIFMVNPKRIIDDGGKGLMRGFFLQNSEVGAGAFKITAFYLENVCGNHICWNVSELNKLKIVHKGSANNRFKGEMRTSLQHFSDEATTNEERLIRYARQFQLGKNREKVTDFLYNRKALQLTKTVIEGSYQLGEKYEKDAKAPPTSAWGFCHGLTRYSQRYGNADERNKLDSIGGKILEMVQDAHK